MAVVLPTSSRPARPVALLEPSQPVSLSRCRSRHSRRRRSRLPSGTASRGRRSRGRLRLRFDGRHRRDGPRQVRLAPQSRPRSGPDRQEAQHAAGHANEPREDASAARPTPPRARPEGSVVRLSPLAASRKALAKSVAVSYRASGSLASTRCKTRSSAERELRMVAAHGRGVDVDDAVEHGGEVGGVERIDPGDRFVEHDAEGEQVAPRIGGLAPDHLGRHVGRRPQHRAGLRVTRARGCARCRSP